MFYTVYSEIFYHTVTHADSFKHRLAETTLSCLSAKPIFLALLQAQIHYWAFDFISSVERERRMTLVQEMMSNYTIDPVLCNYVKSLIDVFLSPQSHARTPVLSDFGMTLLRKGLEGLSPTETLSREVLATLAITYDFSYEHLASVFFTILRMRCLSKNYIMHLILHKDPITQDWKKALKIVHNDCLMATIRLKNANPKGLYLLWANPTQMDWITHEFQVDKIIERGPSLLFLDHLSDSLVANWVHSQKEILSRSSLSKIFQRAVYEGSLWTLEATQPDHKAKNSDIRGPRPSYEIPMSVLLKTKSAIDQLSYLVGSEILLPWIGFLQKEGITTDLSMMRSLIPEKKPIDCPLPLEAFRNENQRPWSPLITFSHKVHQEPLIPHASPLIPTSSLFSQKK